MWRKLILLGAVLLILVVLRDSDGANPTSTTAQPVEVVARVQNAFYVSPEGNDDNPGTEAQPWQSIGMAARTLEAGDTVYMVEGTYNERVEVTRSGGPDAPLTFAALPGAAVVVDGTGIELPDDVAGVFQITGQSHIRVVGLQVVNAGPCQDNGGIIVIDSSHIVLQDNKTQATQSSGIGVWQSEDVTLVGNTVEGAGISGYQECITVARTDGFEVRGNRVLTGEKEGICLKDGSRNGLVVDNYVEDVPSVGIYVDGWDKHTFNIKIARNTVFNVGGDGFAVASEMGGLVEGITFENNVAYHNEFYGFSVPKNSDAANQPVDGVRFLNNTAYDNGWDEWGGGLCLENADARNVLVRNNLFSANKDFQIQVAAPASEPVIDHNLIDGFQGTEGETRGVDWIEGDPLFVDAPGGDFHLRPGSPAIGQGVVEEAPSEDRAGRSRASDGDGGLDLGAYEAE